MATIPVIECRAVIKDYVTDAGALRVLKGIDLLVMPGEFVAIMGPSGSGKSTLMNLLGCLDVPTAGHFLLAGADVGTLAESELARLRNQVIGFVFQGFNLLTRATLEDNVALPLVYARAGAGERRVRAREVLGKVGLGVHALRPRGTRHQFHGERGDSRLRDLLNNFRRSAEQTELGQVEGGRARQHSLPIPDGDHERLKLVARHLDPGADPVPG